MKRSQSITRKYGIIAAAFFVFVVFSGCDALNSDKPEFSELTEEDLEAASAILGESLSDQTEGLMADLNDMTADVDVRQIAYSGRRFHDNPTLRPCRGVNREFESSYDETTGMHSIHYSRVHESENCAKSVEVNLNYIFTDSTGAFIAAPRVNRQAIASISFEGSRAGSARFVTPRGATHARSSEQRGQWNLSGILSDVASLTGSQTNDGSYEHTRLDSTGAEITKAGSFHIEFSTVDVTIAHNSTTETDVETQVTGTIQYTMTMEVTRNGETELKETEGTIELAGDGHALLRFLGLRKVYRVSLRDGMIKDSRDDHNGNDEGDKDENDGEGGEG